MPNRFDSPMQDIRDYAGVAIQEVRLVGLDTHDPAEPGRVPHVRIGFAYFDEDEKRQKSEVVNVPLPEAAEILGGEFAGVYASFKAGLYAIVNSKKEHPAGTLE